ncbi:hypothetical protein [Helicobacter trogontum]|nr:hypothetical protein [Helicobacter trogontum]
MVKNNIESNAVRYITEVLQEQLIMRKNKKGGGHRHGTKYNLNANRKHNI